MFIVAFKIGPILAASNNINKRNKRNITKQSLKVPLLYDSYITDTAKNTIQSINQPINLKVFILINKNTNQKCPHLSVLIIW